MQSGDILTDDRGASWVLDNVLGRGLWGTTWSIKGEDGTLAVLKVPHGPKAFGDSRERDALAQACASAALTYADDLEASRFAFLPKLLGRIDVAGRTGLIMPRYAASLEARLAGGMPFVEVLELVTRVLHRLAHASSAGVVHGNLRPANIFLDDGGNPVLADPLAAELATVRPTLERTAARASYLPPEAGEGASPQWDTWAMCLVLYRAAMAPGLSEDGMGRKPELPREGLGRVDLAAVKDAAAARLRAESANKRFANRATSKLGAILSRGLSAEVDPSPPYRFARADDLLQRLVEVDELVHPAVESVSKVLLGAASRDGVFEGGELVAFSVNVGTTAGVTAQEDLAVGVQLHDRDAKGDKRVRVDGSRFSVDRYPSGKWRFEFQLPDVPPGRYDVHVAFGVKESSDTPEIAAGSFEVRPRPGYVPPPSHEEGPAPIPMPKVGQAPTEASEPTAPQGNADDGPDTFIRRPAPPRPIRPSEAHEAADPTEPASEGAPRAQVPYLQAVPTAPPTDPGPPSGVESTDWTTPATSPTPKAMLPEAAPPPLPTLRIDVEPPSTPTMPVPAPTPAGGAPEDDPFLHDYPPPVAGGADLPVNPFSGGAVAPQGKGWFDPILSRVRDDPALAAMVALGSTFIVVVLALSLLRSC